MSQADDDQDDGTEDLEAVRNATPDTKGLFGAAMDLAAYQAESAQLSHKQARASFKEVREAYKDIIGSLRASVSEAHEALRRRDEEGLRKDAKIAQLEAKIAQLEAGDSATQERIAQIEADAEFKGEMVRAGIEVIGRPLAEKLAGLLPAEMVQGIMIGIGQRFMGGEQPANGALGSGEAQ